MARLNWQTASARDRAARQGSEARDGSYFGSPTPAKHASKSDMRREIAAAEKKITRQIVCECGHSGQVILPASWHARRLRCSKCGVLQ